MKKQGICPNCEQHVEWTTLDNGNLRCNNCWHHITPAEADRLDELQLQLKRIEEERRAALAAYR
jgi:PHP family Zn ribbon phosphoesterase